MMIFKKVLGFKKFYFSFLFLFRKIKIIQKHVKKSKLLLNRAGIISVVEEESPPPPPKHDDRDPFYIGTY